MSRYRILLCFASLLVSSSPNVSAQSQTSSKTDLIILIDGTPSVDQTRLTEALAELRKSAPAIARASSRVRIGVFSDEGPFTKIGPAIEVPVQSPSQKCSEPANAKASKLDVTAVFPGIRDYQENLITKQCNAQNSYREEKSRNDFDAAVEKIRASIPRSVKPKSGCTDIVGLLRYVLAPTAASKSTILLITDGEETCSKVPFPHLRIPKGSTVAFFLIPKKGQICQEGPKTEKRGKMWQDIIPGAIVRPYTDLPDVIDYLSVAPDSWGVRRKKKD